MRKSVLKCVSFVVAAVLIFGFLPIKANAVSVSAKAMVLMNADTFEVLDSKDEHTKLPMASTTKLMTALIIAENCDLQTEIVATKEMVTVEGSSMGLKEGDIVSFYELLVGMMLPSGNDAANTAAIAYSGSVSKFADEMNNKAIELGMKNTRFVTPSGLHDDEHYSTAYDMALLAVSVLKNEVLAEIVSKPTMTVEFGNPPYKRTLTNHNKLLSKSDSVIGLKTGYTKKAGRCLVSAARENGCTVVAVTLNDPDDWQDHERLLSYGLSLLTVKSFKTNVDCIFVPIVGAENSLIKSEALEFSCGAADEEITYKVHHEPFLYAPIEKGQTVGKVDYYCNGMLINSVPIIALESANAKEIKQSAFLLWIKEFYSMLCRCIG